VSDGGSDLPDASVVGCIMAAFRSLQFPEPPSGIITVNYPLAFQPEGHTIAKPDPDVAKPEAP
jgi:hypothetical protein